MAISFAVVTLVKYEGHAFSPRHYVANRRRRSIMRSTAVQSEQETSMTDNTRFTQSEPKSSSKALRSILGEAMTPADFFQNAWQQKPYLFRNANTTSSTNTGDGKWHDDRMDESPLEEMSRQAWHVLIDLLERGPTQSDAPELALVMKNRQVQNREECFEKYGSTLFGPYLDGCSIVQNHADLISPWIAALCQDLQQTFPYVYANTYLTPPNSQAMNPHADDREVFVIQLCGSKHWEVFEDVPIYMPYHHEQVGKSGLHVPKEVLEGDCSISTTLQPGDVLYIPRGHVHQAHCTDSLSFHVTIAIATFDWTLAGMMNMATNSILTKVNEYRSGILPFASDDSIREKEKLQSLIDDAFRLLKEHVTADTILSNLENRIDTHVQRDTPIRMKLIEQAEYELSSVENDTDALSSQDMVVDGIEAARQLSLKTRIRAATREERDQLQFTRQRLVVREELESNIQDILTKFQEDLSFECCVSDLRAMMSSKRNPAMCDLALLGLAKRAVELGELAVVR